MLWQYMGIAERQAKALVPKHFLHFFQRPSTHHHVRRCRMPEIGNCKGESLFGEPPQETTLAPFSGLVNAQKHTVKEVHARLKIRPFHSLRLQWAIAANMCHTAESRNHDHKERP